jgi:hypothetical protein
MRNKSLRQSIRLQPIRVWTVSPLKTLSTLPLCLTTSRKVARHNSDLRGIRTPNPPPFAGRLDQVRIQVIELHHVDEQSSSPNWVTESWDQRGITEREVFQRDRALGLQIQLECNGD